MRDRIIGQFTFAGLKWEIVVDDAKIKAAKCYYIKDLVQCKIIVGTECQGDAVPNSAILHAIMKGIIAIVLELSEEDEYATDSFLYPFASFLIQFIQTDTFNGEEGVFKLGGVQYKVKVDDSYSFHRNINGEHDYSIASIILAGKDAETGEPRKKEFINFIYIHEVVHALLHFSGKTEHKEKFVKTFGCFLYEILTSLTLQQNNLEIGCPIWPKY